MCSSTNIVSALGMFLRSHSRLVGLPIATGCVFIAALLLGIVVQSAAQPVPCDDPYGDDYDEYGNNPCQEAQTSCAPSGPGYSCTVNGVPTGTPEWYSFSALPDWYICIGGGFETYCSYQINQQKCGGVNYFYKSGCPNGTTCDDNWIFVACAKATTTH